MPTLLANLAYESASQPNKVASSLCLACPHSRTDDAYVDFKVASLALHRLYSISIRALHGPFGVKYHDISQLAQRNRHLYHVLLRYSIGVSDEIASWPSAVQTVRLHVQAFLPCASTSFSSAKCSVPLPPSSNLHRLLIFVLAWMPLSRASTRCES